MTRLFTDGAEMKDLLFFSGFGTFSPSVSSATYASGVASYEFSYSAEAAYKNLTADKTEIYFRERVRDNASNNASTFVAFRKLTNTIAKVTVDALGRWIAVIGTTTVDTAVETMAKDTWYCLEVWYKLAAAPNGRFVIKIDGNTVCDFTGDTDPSAYGGIDNLYWVQAGGSVPIFYIDDLALNDTAGGSDDSWCGGGRIIKITPDGNGVTNDWDGSDGNKVDNYLLVDEYPSDGDTTYVYADGTAAGTEDGYAMSHYDFTNKTIERIWSEARGRKTSAEAATLLIGFDTGASENTDNAGTLYETISTRLLSAEYTTNPDDAAAWEEADIDALEFIAEVG
jgi:hypothetical protein